MLAQQPGEHEAAVTAPGSGELNSQHERELRRFRRERHAHR